MKNSHLSIFERENSNGSYSICFENTDVNRDFIDKIKEIIKHFAVGNEFFFGHYRTDGFNISNEKFLQYGLEIPEFFKANGKYKKIIKGKEKKIGFITSPPLELIICRAPNNEKTIDMFDKIFHYYLETVLFCPKIDWETFAASYSDYMKHAARDYVLNGYTDFLFAYVDSGDFSISFDPKVYDPKRIREQINQLLLGYKQ